MKQPTASRTRFETSRNTTGSWIAATIAGARVCGMREIDMHQPSAPATMTRTATMPVVSALLMRMAGRSFSDKVRYTAKPRKSAYRQATAAASVGVNNPLNIPPSRITGVSSAHTLSLNAIQTSLKPPKAWRGRPWRGAMIATSVMSDRPMSAPGTTPARNRRPIDTSALTP